MWAALFQRLAAVLASKFTTLLRCIQVVLRAQIRPDGSWVTLAPKFEFNLCFCCIMLSVIIVESENISSGFNVYYYVVSSVFTEILFFDS